MLSVEEAKSRILAGVQPLGVERVAIAEAHGRVLAADLRSKLNLPPWDNSAMDGFALRFEDVHTATADKPVALQVTATIAAGSVAHAEVGPHEAMRIMTGAPVPAGADTIVPIEHTDGDNDVARIKQAPAKAGMHIRRLAEDVRVGDVVLSAGKVMTPARIALAAGSGHGEIDVFMRPRVAILSTGNELVEPGQEPAAGQIVSTNSYSLMAQVREAGGIPVYLGIARDDPEAIRARLQGAQHVDLLLTSGGVSVGDFDFVKDVLLDLGMKLDFWKIAMKPGKPLAFGHVNGRPVLGLPGNPVASMVGFDVFVRPLLKAMMGCQHLEMPMLKARLAGGYKKRDDRLHFVRVCLRYNGEHWLAQSSGLQGSGVLSSMAAADALAVIPAACHELAEGDEVEVRILNVESLLRRDM